MTIDANELEGLKVDFKVADLWGAKIVSGFAQLARAEVGGQSITGVKLTATGDASASDLDLSGNARGLAINARGRLFGGPPTRFELASFAAQGGGQRITLAGPATVSLRSQRPRHQGSRASVSALAGCRSPGIADRRWR